MLQSVAQDGENGMGQKLEKIGNVFKFGRLFNSISHDSFAALTCEISSRTLDEKFDPYLHPLMY